MGLITNFAEFFKARETPVRGWYSDQNGRYAFRVDLDGHRFVATAKKYLNDGDASFMRKKIVQRAQDMDAYIILFVGSTSDRLIFDPDTVEAAGTDDATAEDARRKRGEEWIDVPARYSVGLQEWYDHGEQPPTPTDAGIDPSTGQTDLSHHTQSDR